MDAEISKIIFNEDALEADVELMSDGIKILCYFHPVETKSEIVSAVKNGLIAFDVKNIMVEDGAPIAIKTEDGFYSYYLRGFVVSKTQIKVNNFLIDIGNIPGDVDVGMTICCNCLRIDMCKS